DFSLAAHSTHYLAELCREKEETVITVKKCVENCRTSDFAKR
ncbi:5305_t:CDS:1, partial [Entrophospora sp. SA101]